MSIIKRLLQAQIVLELMVLKVQHMTWNELAMYEDHHTGLHLIETQHIY